MPNKSTMVKSIVMDDETSTMLDIIAAYDKQNRSEKLSSLVKGEFKERNLQLPVFRGRKME